MNIEIEWKGVKFDVDFSYQEAEPAETGIYAQYPGCGEDVTGINSFEYLGTCFLEFIEDEEEEVGKIILENIHRAW